MKKKHLFLFCLLTLLFSCTQRNSHTKLNSAINSLEDAKTARFAVVTGNLHDIYVTNNLTEATPVRLDNYSDVLMALEAGRADVACVEGSVFQTALKPKGIYRNIGVLFDDPYGVGFNKKNPELCSNFNAFLKEVKENGMLAEMESRWVENFLTARMPDLGTPPAGTQLRVGCAATTEVFDFMQDGKHAGFDIELAERFGRYIGQPVQFFPINFGGLISALSSGKVDMIISAISITDERKKQIDFSDSYYNSQSIAIVMDYAQTAANNASPATSIHDGSDLPTARVAAMTGTTGEIFLTKEYPKAQLLLFDDINDAFLALKTGKADYVLTSYTTSLLAAKNSKGLVVLPQNYIQEYAAIAINKKDTALLREINEALQLFKENGTLNDIIKHWIRTDGSDYETAEIPTVNTGKPLRVGIAANREPMCFIANGNIVGLDAELIERIACKLERPIEYSDMKFSALLAALESGRVDLIISNFSPTPERLKRVNFSEVYFMNPQVLTTFVKEEIVKQDAKLNWLARVKESFINNIMVEKRYLLIFNGFKQTILITFFAIILGTLVGGIICSLRMSRNKISVAFAKLYISVMRGTPILVLLMIFFYIIFASTGLSATLIAIITFALNMGAYSSEMFRTAIQSIEKGQTEAGIALGFTKVQTFIFVIFPQALQRVIPVYKGEVISLLKMTSIVGYIAVIDLTKASDIIRSRTFDAFFPLIVVAIIYFLLAWLLGVALDKLNQKISSK